MRTAVTRTAVLLWLSLASPGWAGQDLDTLFDQPDLASSADRSRPPGPADPAMLAAITEALHGVENLEIQRLGEGFLFEGELLTVDDLTRVETVAGSMPGSINLCSLHPIALKTAARYLNRTIDELRLSGLRIEVFGKSLVLTGSPARAGDPERVLRISAASGLKVVNDSVGSSEAGRMVLFEVAFTEINRQSIRDLGVSWPSSLTLVDPSGVSLKRLTPAQPLELTINLFIQRGDARIISRPRLVCRSGEDASFQAGGEIPIPTLDTDGNISVTWKNYGIILKVTPRVGPGNSINVEITTEVSTVDYANSVEGIPGILTRRITTAVTLQSGQTITLSGLVKSDEAENIEKLPLLGDVPILGELFKSREFQRRESELVVFLTPQLVDWEAEADRPALIKAGGMLSMPPAAAQKGE